MKICKMCNLEKDLVDMVKDKRRYDGYTNFCKECNKLKINLQLTPEKKLINSIRDRKYREENKEYFIKYNKKYKEENREYFREYAKEYAKNNDSLKEYQEKYRNKNKEYFNEYNKDYYLENSEHLKNKSKEYKKNNKDKANENIRLRRKNDFLFALSNNIRKSILKAIKASGHLKTLKTHEILGCSFTEFKIYIESKFENWMTWENRGKYNGEYRYGWDLDHIIPISSAKTEEEVYKLNHYTNFQPLCSKINRDIKRDNF